MSKGAILGLLVTAMVVGLIAWSIQGVKEVTCEVCITFKGETVCRTGQGRTQADAQRTAAESACAVLPAAGMAERIRCADQEPSSLSCR